MGDSTVTTTEDHEFWNVTDQAWQETQHIDAGDLLLPADGATVEVGTLLWDTAHVAPAFDLTIDEIHTYPWFERRYQEGGSKRIAVLRVRRTVCAHCALREFSPSVEAVQPWGNVVSR